MNIGGDTLSIAATQFSLRLLSQLATQSPGENVVVSPISLFQALSLYALVGNESAKHEMRAALRLTNLSDDLLREMYVRLSARLSINSSDTKLIAATALWLGSDLKVDISFANLAAEWGISVFSGNDVSAETMRAWSLEKTHGLLSALGPPPGPIEANLMNAVYFRGTWESKFDLGNTKDRSFHRSGGTPKSAPLMRLPETRTVSLYHGGAFDAARIPYKSDGGHDLSLHVVLPKQSLLDSMIRKDTTTPLAREFSIVDWDACQANYYPARVDLILPRFKLQQTHELTETLMRMGFKGPFQTTPDPAQSLLPKIQRVVQQAYISTDEDGTTAAALTELMLIGAAPEFYIDPLRLEKFYVERPFLFFLADDSSNLILFAGVIHDPSDGRDEHSIIRG